WPPPPPASPVPSPALRRRMPGGAAGRGWRALVLDRRAGPTVIECWERPLTAPLARRSGMSFQAYLDAVEARTGLTPRQIVELARAKGFDGAGVKAGEILAWLKADYDLGRGHGMALVHVIRNG